MNTTLNMDDSVQNPRTRKNTLTIRRTVRLTDEQLQYLQAFSSISDGFRHCLDLAMSDIEGATHANK